MTDPGCTRCGGTGDMNAGGTALDPPAPCDRCTMPLHKSDPFHDWMIRTVGIALHDGQITEQSARDYLHEAGIPAGEDSFVMTSPCWLWVLYDSPTRYSAVRSRGGMLPVTSQLYRDLSHRIAERINSRRTAA